MTGRPDFDAGDVVECIDDGRHPLASKPPSGIKRGGTYRIAEVYPHFRDNVWIARLAGVQSSDRSGGFAADRFRKIRPASDSFTARIRACQPINGKVSA